MVSQALSRIVTILCVCLLASSVHAQTDAPVRILLSIGQDIGAPQDEPLRYAERDAERVAQVMTSLGEVAPDRAYVVTAASADRVRQVIAEIRGRSIELKNVVLITYVSSHADDLMLHLGSSQLAMQELRDLLSSVRARLRLLVVDACTSGTLIRYKGGKAVVPFAIDLERSNPVEGQVVITSAGPSEPAQEWEALGGSLFTHHLMSALRGAADRNADGRVTLFEAYSYTYDHTLASSTIASAGMQHALHEFDLRGAGDFVLTRPAQRGSGIELGRKLAGHYVVSVAMGGELVAELDKAAGHPLRLALDAGRYLVRKPEGSFVRVGEVGVLPNQVASVDDEQLERVPYMEVARRGAGPIPSWSMEARAGIATSSVAGKGFGPRFGLGLSRERGPFAYSAALEAGLQNFAANRLAVRQRDVWAGLEFRRRWALAWVLPFLGARAALGWVHQAYGYQSRALYTKDVPDMPSKMGLIGELFVLGGVEVPARRLMVRPQLGAGGFMSKTMHGLHVLPAALGRVDVGLRF